MTSFWGILTLFYTVLTSFSARSDAFLDISITNIIKLHKHSFGILTLEHEYSFLLESSPPAFHFNLTFSCLLTTKIIIGDHCCTSFFQIFCFTTYTIHNFSCGCHIPDCIFWCFIYIYISSRLTLRWWMMLKEDPVIEITYLF